MNGLVSNSAGHRLALLVAILCLGYSMRRADDVRPVRRSWRLSRSAALPLCRPNRPNVFNLFTTFDQFYVQSCAAGTIEIVPSL